MRSPSTSSAHANDEYESIIRSVKALPSITVALAIIVLALADGMLEVTLGSRSDDLEGLLSASPAELGRILGAFPIGMLLGSLSAIWLLQRIGTKVPLFVAVAAFFGPLIAISHYLDSPSPSDVLPVAILWVVSGVGCGMLNPILAAHANAFTWLGRAGNYVLLFQVAKVAGFAFGSWFGKHAITTALSVVEHFWWIGVLAFAGAFLAALRLPNLHPRAGRGARGKSVKMPRLLGFGATAGAAAVLLGGAIGWASKIFAELEFGEERKGDALFAFCSALVVALIWTFFRSKRGSRKVAVRGMLGAGLGAVFLATSGADHELRFLPDGWAFPVAIAAFALLGAGSAPLIGFILRATGNVVYRHWSDVSRLSLVMSIQFAMQALATMLVGVVAERIAVSFGLGVGVAAAYVAACLVALVAMLCFSRKLFDDADEPRPETEAEVTPAAAPEPARARARVALSPKPFVAFGGSLIARCADDVAFVDVQAAGAPEAVVGDVAAVLAELQKADAPPRPAQLLVPVVTAEVGPRRNVERFSDIDPYQELVAKVRALPAVAELQEAHSLYGGGATALLVVRLEDAADIAVLQTDIHYLAAQFAGVAHAQGEPIRRIILAMPVSTTDVVRSTSGPAPLVDLGLAEGTPLAVRVQRIGHALAALWEHASACDRLLVAVAERGGSGAPSEHTADLVHAMATGAALLGGAQPDEPALVLPGVLFQSVAGYDAAAAERTADLLASQLGVGDIAVGWTQPIVRNIPEPKSARPVVTVRAAAAARAELRRPRIVRAGDDDALLDVLATAAPEAVLADVAAVLGELREEPSRRRPVRLLVPVAQAEVEPGGPVGRFAMHDPYEELVGHVSTLSAIAEIESARRLLDERPGGTALLAVRLQGGADVAALQERIRFLAAQYAGVAQEGNEPIRRIVLVLPVWVADVESAGSSPTPVVDLGLAVGAPVEQRVQRIGGALAALWEQAAKYDRLLVAVAEHRGAGAPSELTAELVHSIAERAARHGGAEPDGLPVVLPNLLFQPVAGYDAAAAERTADLLARHLRVGPITVGWPQPIG